MLRYNGVPSSLNVISKKIGKGGPLLQPYPDWSFAKYDDCSGIVSASQLAVIEHCLHNSMIILTINFPKKKKIHSLCDI